MRTTSYLIASLLLLTTYSAGARTPSCGPMEHKIVQTIIPKVSFSNAVLSDVISYIRDASVENDPEHDEPKGVDILVDADDDALSTKFTMDLRHVSLQDLLRHVARIAGLQVRHEGRIVLLTHSDGPIINRVYEVLPTVFAASETGGKDVRQFLSELGVRFPEGASVSYVPGIGKLFAANTAKNLVVLEGILESLNVVRSQVELSCSIVALSPGQSTNLNERLAEAAPLTTLTVVVSSGQTSSNRITQLETAGKSARSLANAELVFTPTVSPGGQLIALSYSVSVTLPSDKNGYVEYQGSSQVTAYDGALLAIQLLPPAGSGDSRNLAITITPRLVDPAGRVIRKTRE